MTQTDTIKTALHLMNSMILSGEAHSETSTEVYEAAKQHLELIDQILEAKSVVKPLVWTTQVEMPWRWVVVMPPRQLSYNVSITDWNARAQHHGQKSTDGFTLNLPGGQENHDTLEQAKTAAQADYEKRILSALEVSDG